MGCGRGAWEVWRQSKLVGGVGLGQGTRPEVAREVGLRGWKSELVGDGDRACGWGEAGLGGKPPSSWVWWGLSPWVGSAWGGV